jgi:hypothetical protein
MGLLNPHRGAGRRIDLPRVHAGELYEDVNGSR